MTKKQREFNGEKTDLSADGAGTTGHPYVKWKPPCQTTKKYWSPFHTSTKIILKCVIELKVKPKMIRLLEENMTKLWWSWVRQRHIWPKHNP